MTVLGHFGPRKWGYVTVTRELCGFLLGHSGNSPEVLLSISVGESGSQEGQEGLVRSVPSPLAPPAPGTLGFSLLLHPRQPCAPHPDFTCSAPSGPGVRESLWVPP